MSKRKLFIKFINVVKTTIINIKTKVPIERHNIDYSILSFDLSLMYDFNTVDFQQTAKL